MYKARLKKKSMICKITYLILSLSFRTFLIAHDFQAVNIISQMHRWTKEKGPAGLSCDAAALNRTGTRNIPPPENHRALRQLAKIGEQRLILLPHRHRHVLHLPADRAFQDAGGGHIVEPPELGVVVVAEKNRRVAGEFEIGLRGENGQLLRLEPGGGLFRRGSGAVAVAGGG